MKYHSLTIRPNNIYVQESMENDTIIKSVSLTPCVEKDSIRSSLIATIDGQQTTICNLLTNKMESKILNIPVKQGVRIELRTEGVNEMDILFLEMDPHEVNTNEEETVYRTIQVPGNASHTVDEISARILNVSIAYTEEVVDGTSKVFMKSNGETTLLAELEIGRKECEVVDVLADAQMELVVEGPHAIDFLIVEGSKGGPLEDASCEVEDEQDTEDAQESAPQEEKNEEMIGGIVPETCQKGERKRKCPEETKEPEETQPQEEKKVKLSEAKKKESEEKVEETEIETQSMNIPQENAVVSDIKTISDGIGKIVGKKSFITAEYTVSSGENKKESFSEVVLVRRMADHAHLRYFSDVVKGAREGAVFKAEIKAADAHTEVVLNVGKIRTGQ
ncbi:hypothetical protein NERG_00881 [Nematocida ausubeli]|uniref:Nucleoplasmin-like domain-containing protein n=1 Tax=Nematocida ausubeli (strain ATCC PRA-371 / ERTm2) TaxID=1913371 RepID=H8ZBD2_NEMA1|nr:hypothetical protein NERG_00881 [Nematocida ausubeli]